MVFLNYDDIYHANLCHLYICFQTYLFIIDNCYEFIIIYINIKARDYYYKNKKINFTIKHFKLKYLTEFKVYCYVHVCSQ